MEHKEHRSAEPTDDEATSNPSPIEHSAGSVEWDELFEETEPMFADDFEQRIGDIAPALDHLKEAVSRIEERVASLDARSSRVEEHIERLKIDDQVLTEMHERNCKLTEEFHEREVLQPVLLGLIGIADRCEQKKQEVEREAHRRLESANQAGRTALRSIWEAREADRVEIDGLLALLGVECFESASEVFDPVTQTCVQRVTNLDPSLPGRVAYRLLPGYRRGERVVRQERVAVYVAEKPKLQEQKGA